jgi:hypothetical protein
MKTVLPFVAGLVSVVGAAVIGEERPDIKDTSKCFEHNFPSFCILQVNICAHYSPCASQCVSQYRRQGTHILECLGIYHSRVTCSFGMWESKG